MRDRSLPYICDLNSRPKAQSLRPDAGQPSTVNKMNRQLRIAITDCGKFDNYRRWIESEPGVQVVKLSMLAKNAGDMDQCDGVIFSGGEDVHPALYGKPEFELEYGLKEIIPERDQFEYQVIAKAFTEKKPVLGICRGLQLINVFLEGTLVPDIPAVHQSKTHGKQNGADQTHFLSVIRDTLLYNICGQEIGSVNSAHHQSVDKPGELLRISAYSEPSIVEAMEWKDPENKSWLLMVQWHPERMSDLSSPFSALVKKAFLDACNPG
jgi:putative glutamine amidotransferase